MELGPEIRDTSAGIGSADCLRQGQRKDIGSLESAVLCCAGVLVFATSHWLCDAARRQGDQKYATPWLNSILTIAWLLAQPMAMGHSHSLLPLLGDSN